MIWWIPLIGAAIGALAYEDDPWTGALIGAGIGMTGGAAAGAAGFGAAGAGAAGTAGAGLGASGAGITATAGTGLGLAGTTGGFGTLVAPAATGAGYGLLGAGGASTAATAGATGFGSLVAPAAAGSGYGLLGAGTAGAGFMTQAKPWLDAGASMVQQSGILNQQPQGGPQHQPLPQYQGSDVGNQISSQGGDMLQANAMRREENKRRREMQNPFAFGRF
jgi:hypothetical protein